VSRHAARAVENGARSSQPFTIDAASMAIKNPADATLLVGTVKDAAHARNAFDSLMIPERGGHENLAVALYGTGGHFLVLVAAMTLQAERWAAGVLREQGATVEERNFVAWVSELRNSLAHGVGAKPDDVSLVSASATAFLFLALERGLVEPQDLLTLLVASQTGARVSPKTVADNDKQQSVSDERRRKSEADEELREVSERLQSALRMESPELFDRRGRLRRKVLSKRLAERTGGSTWFGDDLLTLEQSADAKLAR
jgi:hypothetical protein